MAENFRSFVIFAEMRTGSNLLEATLNAIKKVTCFGEAFNPYMMGWPDKDELQGITREEREADPILLLNKLFDKPGHLPGFRYFHDHDPRVFDAIMDDRLCAKIILTRNPLESYVSTRLAWETNQWKLNETETPIPASIKYDGEEFRQMLSDIREFQLRVMHRLQTSGQSSFWLGYSDLRDSEVMTGLMHWLGRTDLQRVDPASDQVPQNPRSMEDKVSNFQEMQADLHQLDPFALGQVPNFEPRRGPTVPSFTTSEAGSGLIYMPIKGGVTISQQEWFKGLGQVTRDYTQSSLRQWKRQHPGHRSFTILRHPLHRAWDAFLQLLSEAKPELRQLMRETHRVPLPEDAALAELNDDQVMPLFRDFLEFLGRNLSGQTTLPTHPHWATQSAVLGGFGRFAQPDMLLREERLEDDIAYLCKTADIPDPQMEKLEPGNYPAFLSDKDLISAARSAYMRDYIAFGFPKSPKQ
ncbi:sulfotransferase family 2 domain-containing protein [Paracoccus saliphilus]|uniref:Sulfotransferase family 2 domain-containing protein n=1 Tax=Paracoccus saliphilus TaxID=405559 RepID=A0AA45W7J4_9RHOB|nr:sulfotransferase family 2 domain-containing protein [Paracoccus saliphilus]WCR03056.1 sulfotransferase family 2 domain-containing protein [Paracoccus saliphilus]SIT10244.1 Sulfotransferase family protein [Paracoccus saliphilus]